MTSKSIKHESKVVPYTYWADSPYVYERGFWVHDHPTCQMRGTLEGYILYYYADGTNTACRCKACGVELGKPPALEIHP